MSVLVQTLKKMMAARLGVDVAVVCDGMVGVRDRDEAGV